MTNKLGSKYRDSEKGRFLAALRRIGGRSYLTGGPVLGLVVIALFATGFALSAIAVWFSRAEHSTERRDGANARARL